jgi:light-regulated signal transduction histidine kinase (bacteriophytochrome)
LAIKDEELWAAIAAYHDGDQRVSGEAVRVRGDLFGVLTSCTELMHEVATALKDGKVDRIEAVRLLKLLRKIVQLIEARVIPDLEALNA